MKGEDLAAVGRTARALGVCSVEEMVDKLTIMIAAARKLLDLPVPLLSADAELPAKVTFSADGAAELFANLPSDVSNVNVVVESREEVQTFEVTADRRSWQRGSEYVATGIAKRVRKPITSEQSGKPPMTEPETELLQLDGWMVLRFTGSEIHKDADDCAGQVLQALRLIS